MKRIVKTLLACVTALLLLPAGALCQDISTLDIAALMARQVSGNSTLRFQVTADLSEKAPFFTDDGTWQALRSAAGMTLDGSYIFSRAGETLGNSQMCLSLTRGEEEVSSLYISGRGEEWQIWGGPAGDRLIVLPRQTDLLLRDRYLTLAGWGGVLLRGAGFAQAQWDPPGEGQWPALWRLITLAATQDDAWKERFADALSPLTDQISSWMQRHTAVKLVRDADGTVGTSSLLQADGQELREEILDLLRTFFSDRTLLNLLRPLMTRQEAESYLEPGMSLLYADVLEKMELPSSFTLERLYDSEGEMTRTRLVLPLADGTCFSWTSDGKTSVLRAEKGQRAMEISLPEEMGPSVEGQFTLQTGEASHTGRYQLSVSPGDVYEDEDADGRKRRQEGEISLVIVPDADQSFPAQTLTVSLQGTSGLETDRPARVYITLDWQELGGGAYAQVTLRTRTAAAVRQAEAVGIRTVPEDRQQREELLRQVLSALAEAVMGGE